MTAVNIELRVDTRDYEVKNQFHITSPRAVVIKNGKARDVAQLAAEFSLCPMTIRRRLRAMVSWSELVSGDRGHYFDLLMPSVNDTITGCVNWDAFVDKRDYTIVSKGRKLKGNTKLIITYKGQTELVSELSRQHNVPYATVRKRIERGLCYSDVFLLDHHRASVPEVNRSTKSKAIDKHSVVQSFSLVHGPRVLALLWGSSSVFPAIGETTSLYVSDHSEPMVVGGGV